MIKEEMAKPTVSIITPTYNQKDFIGHCIESVLAQTFEDWEMLIVDDGSTDGTQDVIEGYKDRRISLIRLPHRGIAKLSETYNAALGRVRGHLLALLDGDDWWPRDKLALQAPVFKDGDIAISFGSAATYNEDEKLTRICRIPRFAQGKRPGGLIALKILSAGYYPYSVTSMVRVEAIRRLGGFVQPQGLPLVDTPTWLNVLCGSHSFGMTSLLGCYRVHGGSVCRRREKDIVAGQQSYNEYFLAEHWRELGLSRSRFVSAGRYARGYNNYVRGMLEMKKGMPKDAARLFAAAIRDGSIMTKSKAVLRSIENAVCAGS